MATSRIALDTARYVRVNFAYNPIIIEANEGEIRVVVTDSEPALSNTAFHRVTDRSRLVLDRPDKNVWVLAQTASQKAVVTESIPMSYVAAHKDATLITTDTPLIAIHNPSAFAELARISVNCDKKSHYKVWATTDVTAFTGATFAPVNVDSVFLGSVFTTDSPDTNPSAVSATAFDTSKAVFVTSFYVAAAGRVEITNPLPASIKFLIAQGAYIAVTGTSANGTSEVVVEWGEQLV